MAMPDSIFKPVEWIGSSYKEFRAFPDEVQDHMGYALHLAQTGDKHEDAKPLKGFGGAGVLEIVSDHVGDTYRAVYTVTEPLLPFLRKAFPKYVTTTEEVGRAMIAVARRGAPSRVLENLDINRLSCRDGTAA